MLRLVVCGVAWCCLVVPAVACCCLLLPAAACCCLELPGVVCCCVLLRAAACGCLGWPAVAWRCLGLPLPAETLFTLNLDAKIPRNIQPGQSKRWIVRGLLLWRLSDVYVHWIALALTCLLDELFNVRVCAPDLLPP